MTVNLDPRCFRSAIRI